METFEVELLPPRNDPDPDGTPTYRAGVQVVYPPEAGASATFMATKLVVQIDGDHGVIFVHGLGQVFAIGLVRAPTKSQAYGF